MTIQLEAQIIQEQELEKVASGLHGVIGSRLNRHLGNYVDDKQLGHVVDSSTTFEVKDKPPNVSRLFRLSGWKKCPYH